MSTSVTDITDVVNNSIEDKQPEQKKTPASEQYSDTNIMDALSILNEETSENKIKSTESYAKRYAAKEACAKALGTGLARGVFWKDIEVYNNSHGKPKIKLNNKALKFLRKINNESNSTIELSLTDESNYAIANVIIYENKKTK